MCLHGHVLLVRDIAGAVKRTHISHQQHVVERDAGALGHIFEPGKLFRVYHAAQDARTVFFLILFGVRELDLVLDHAHVFIKSQRLFLFLFIIERVALIMAAVAVFHLHVRLLSRHYLRVSLLHEHQKLLGVRSVHAHMVEHLHQRIAAVRAADERGFYLHLFLDGDLLRQKLKGVFLRIVRLLEDDDVLFRIIVIDLPVRGDGIVDERRVQHSHPVHYVFIRFGERLKIERGLEFEIKVDHSVIVIAE